MKIVKYNSEILLIWSVDLPFHHSRPKNDIFWGYSFIQEKSWIEASIFSIALLSVEIIFLFIQNEASSFKRDLPAGSFFQII